MAKKSTTQASGAAFDFAKMDAALSKIPGFELGSLIATNTFSEVDEYIPTGNYLLNACISGSLFRGIPNSRSLGLSGDPETGKTFMCLNFAREAQKMGYDIIYCETEGAVDRATVAKLGCDVNRLRYQPIKTVNQFKRFTVQVIEMVREAREAGQNPKIMIFLDSLGMLTTEKDIRDAEEGKDASDMGIKAKQVRAMFRLITLDLTANKIPLICTNHTTVAGIGSYTGAYKESAGGDGPIFSLSTALMLSKKFDVDDKDKTKKNGIIITARPKKARSTVPTTVTIHVGFNSGMNPFVGLEEYVSWEACGIQKGKIYTEKEYAKEKASNGIPFDWDDVDTATGEVKKTEKLVFVPKETGRWCVKHLGTSLVSGSKLYNSSVFTQDVLRQLDTNVIIGAFGFATHSDGDDMSVFIEEEDGDAE